MFTTLQILWNFVQEHPVIVILYTLFTMFSFPLETILVPRIYSDFLDKLTKPAKNLNREVFYRFFIALFIVLVVVNGSSMVSLFIESILIPDMYAYFYDFIFINLLSKHENQIGDIEIAKVITQLHVLPETLYNILNTVCVWGFPRIITIIMVNIYFIILHWKLGATSISLLFLILFCNYYLFVPCLDHVHKKHRAIDEKNNYTHDKLMNTFAIFSCGNKDVEIKNYLENTIKYTEKFRNSMNCMMKSIACSTVLVIITYLLLIIVPTMLYWNNEMTFMNMTSVIITVIFYVPCLVDINNLFPSVANDLGILSNAEDFIKELYDVQTQNAASTAAKGYTKEDEKLTKSDIVIRDLTFEYLPGKPIFQNFSLTIAERQKVAIVGPSGNGKSTIIKLIMGYYHVSDGNIFIGGKDLNHFTLNELRKQITYVHQKPQLFNMTVLENMQYGNGASRESIIEIMEKHGLAAIFRKGGENGHDNKNNEFLDARVGIDGGNLSGGQKQMVLIMRALMRPKPIVIMDEPTTAIDAENKTHVIRAVKLLCENATVIIVTHERELLSLVDRVVTIKSGKIVKDDTVSLASITTAAHNNYSVF